MLRLVTVRALTVTDATLRPQNLSTAPVAMEQASKIGLGQTRTVMAFFDNSQARLHHITIWLLHILIVIDLDILTS